MEIRDTKEIIGRIKFIEAVIEGRLVLVGRNRISVVQDIYNLGLNPDLYNNLRMSHLIEDELNRLREQL